jgi:transposase-like protein
MKRRGAAAPPVEQLGICFEGIEVVEPPAPEPSPDTMRQIVSLRMPDALLARVEEAAQARGVSPSSLMRALIAAGLDRSYAAVTEPHDMAVELAELRRSVEQLARRLDRSAPADEGGEGRAGA